MIHLCKYWHSMVIVFMLSSCNKPYQKEVATTNLDPLTGTFGYDLNFLRGYDSSLVLLNDGNSQVIVSPQYQAKVFTSTTDGNAGQSFGWINYKAFSSPIDPHMNAYGGENRFWLGPEGGVFSLYFEKGKEMVFDNWKTPAPIDTESWSVISRDEKSVALQKDMMLTNYAGTPLSLSANRKISILETSSIADLLKTEIDSSIKVVGYRTENTIVNMSSVDWNEKTGMPCIWILDMFKPSAQTMIIIPYKTDGIDSSLKVATTDYFGEIPPDRINYNDGVLFFRADGTMRGKLGIGPQRAKAIAGSYDAQNKVLTITLFDVDDSGKYLNQEWNTQKPPFSGDAVNAYNDGPLEDGSIMGPFYEIESVSPAAFLKQGESLSHQHTVFHFTGDEVLLNTLLKEVFGVSIEEITSSF